VKLCILKISRQRIVWLGFYGLPRETVAYGSGLRSGKNVGLGYNYYRYFRCRKSSDVVFVKQLVNWTLPALQRNGVGEGWKGFLYALESLYDKDGAIKKIKRLNMYDDGNSLSNLLWWVHSRD